MTPRRELADRALVVRRFPYGESSLVVHVVTPQHGRLTLIAKGAYRPRSGYCGVLDLFDTLELGWRRQRGSDMGLLARGEIAVRRRGLTRDLQRYRAGLAVLELAGIGAREAEPDPPLFDLTAETLDVLHHGTVEPDLAVTSYDLRFLACMGLTPALVHCAACGTDLARGARGEKLVPFAFGAGGRMCSPCAEEARGSGRRVEGISPGTLRITRSILDTPTAHLPRIRLESRVSNEVRSFTRRFLEYHLETRPRSRRSREPRSRRPARR